MARLTTEDAAYCAAAWASGEKQKDLARRFGFKSPVPICVAIRAFLNAYASQEAMAMLGVDRWTGLTGDLLYDRLIYGRARKSLVPGALRAFQRSRG